MNSENKLYTIREEDYLTFGENREPPSIFKEDGEKCSSFNDCHFGKYCNNGICGDWKPKNVTIEDNGPQREYFYSSPNTNYIYKREGFVQPTTLSYSSSQKSNSGRNYW